ncbi:RlpA-like double-psi beta-barrel-protein domain-containing protein-containing protein [Syncephalis fuscata]|nr:RlpA-like double-psi beta-barrel-protein domain-containing protein-containing protein [Syncephalis fuscata]
MRFSISTIATTAVIAGLAVIGIEAAARLRTWFTPDKDACTGKTSPSTAMIAALSTDMYGKTSVKSKYCGQCARVKGPKGTVVVKIVDACPTCERHSLDLTRSAFQRIANLDAGVVTIQWSWTSCGSL